MGGNQIVCASAAIYDFVELETPKAFENYELCGLRFPTAFMRNITPWSELHDLAFSPFINGLFLNDSMEVDMNKLRPHEFKIITLSRLRLFCCAATRNLTNGVFNFLSYDTVAHGHWKLHNHLDLPAECLGFASTVVSCLSLFTSTPSTSTKLLECSSCCSNCMQFVRVSALAKCTLLSTPSSACGVTRES